MSGTYFAASEDAPGGGAESRAAVASGLAEALAATTVTQAQAHDFFAEYGADVTPGHANVGRPGAMGDPDVGPDAADS